MKKKCLLTGEIPFGRRRSSGAAGAGSETRNPDAAWRRIDGDWLQSAGSLALQLDSLTNNTSLAFAIERISDGKVLLFPADGQLGHWLFTGTIQTLNGQCLTEEALLRRRTCCARRCSTRSVITQARTPDREGEGFGDDDADARTRAFIPRIAKWR